MLFANKKSRSLRSSCSHALKVNGTSGSPGSVSPLRTDNMPSRSSNNCAADAAMYGTAFGKRRRYRVLLDELFEPQFCDAAFSALRFGSHGRWKN